MFRSSVQGSSLGGKLSHLGKGHDDDPELSMPDPPLTPVVYIVLWVSVAVGFARGYDRSTATVAFQNLGFTLTLYGEKAVWKEHFSDGSTRPMWCSFGLNGTTKVDWFEGITMVVGGITPLIAALLCHLYGRKLGLATGAAVGVVSQLLTGLAWHVPQMITGYFLSLMASPLLLLGIILAIVEMAPRHARGRFFMLHFVGYALGCLTAAVLVYVTARTSHWLWRMVILFGTLPYATVLLLLPWISETPSSLIQRMKLNEGWAALKELRGPFHDGVWAEYQSLVAEIHGENPNPTGKQTWPLKDLLQQENQPGLLVGLGLASLGPFLDTLSLVYISQAHFSRVGEVRLGVVATELVLTGSMLLGVVFAAITVDWFGRVFCLTSSSVLGIAAAATVCGLNWTSSLSPTVQSAFINLALMGCLTLATCIGWLTVVWLSVAELQTLRMRTTVLGISMGLAFFLRYLLNFTMLCALHWKMTGVMALTHLASLVFVFLCVPETKQKSLELCDTLLQSNRIWKRFYPQPGPSRAPQEPAGDSSPAAAAAAPGSARAAAVRRLSSPFARQTQQQQRPVGPPPDQPPVENGHRHQNPNPNHQQQQQQQQACELKTVGSGAAHHELKGVGPGGPRRTLSPAASMQLAQSIGLGPIVGPSTGNVSEGYAPFSLGHVGIPSLGPALGFAKADSLKKAFSNESHGVVGLGPSAGALGFDPAGSHRLGGPTGSLGPSGSGLTAVGSYWSLKSGLKWLSVMALQGAGHLGRTPVQIPAKGPGVGEECTGDDIMLELSHEMEEEGVRGMRGTHGRRRLAV